MSNKSSIPEIATLSTEAKHLYDVLNGEENELACVLVAVSYLDSALASTLKRYFIAGSETANQLLDPLSRGALSTFASRCDLAYCLGLTTRAFHKNLKTIGKIRNAFAHRYSPPTLDDPEIAKLVDSVTLPMVASGIYVGDDGVEHIKPGPLELPGTRREKFYLIVVLMFNVLLMTGLSTKHREKMTQGWEEFISFP